MIRVLIVLAVLVWGYHEGGWAGLFTMLLVCGAVGAILGPPKAKDVISNMPLPDDKREVPARRGNPDPTRPSREDYAGMLTNFGRRER